MPCINCYIAAMQQVITSWLPSLVAAAFVWLTAATLGRRARAAPLRVPMYGPTWLPPFIRGIMAAVKLGQDEDEFLMAANKQYGPAVYLPWPLKQYFVTDADEIQRVYESKALNFQPVRLQMQGDVFGSERHVVQSGVLESQLFAAHSRGLSKAKLEEPVARFNMNVQQTIERVLAQIDSSSSGATETDLIELVTNALYEGATPALFGHTLFDFDSEQPVASFQATRAKFWAFDEAFPLFAAGLPTLFQSVIPVAYRGKQGRSHVAKHIGQWIDHDLPGLDSGVVRDMADIGRRAQWSAVESGKLLLGTYWALQANAPFAAAHHITCLVQSSLLPRVLDEVSEHVDSFDDPLSFATLSSSSSLPLLTSTIWETLRLNASSFSLRLVGENGYDVATKDKTMTIPPSSAIVCATRVSQLSESIWGKDAKLWKGDRFLTKDKNEDGKPVLDNQLVRSVRAFGGGVSMCEGRHLALVELKSFAIQFFTRINVTVKTPSTAEEKSTLREFRYGDSDRLDGPGKVGYTPVLRSGRGKPELHVLVYMSRELTFAYGRTKSEWVYTSKELLCPSF
ncbi:hypothetical protein OIV83_002407 [Microbotryomycetes sp. JL201]|nr:hypothetical protein OIV83_002407 [Microbotryomycetes sp. JL201]